jgi:hypothetical protein
VADCEGDRVLIGDDEAADIVSVEAVVSAFMVVYCVNVTKTTEPAMFYKVIRGSSL